MRILSRPSALFPRTTLLGQTLLRPLLIPKLQYFPPSTVRTYASPVTTPPTPGNRPPMPREHIPGLITDSPFENELLSLVAHHPLSAEFMTEHSGFTTSRAVLKPGRQNVEKSLTSGALLGPEMIAVNPFVFSDDSEGALLAFYRLGSKLAGHRGIVHGGMSALLLDECGGRAVFGRLKKRVAVTVNLELEYLAPLVTNSYIVVVAETVKVEGRKAWVESRIEDAESGEVYVKAKGLFIEPKWADSLEKV